MRVSVDDEELVCGSASIKSDVPSVISLTDSSFCAGLSTIQLVQQPIGYIAPVGPGSDKIFFARRRVKCVAVKRDDHTTWTEPGILWDSGTKVPVGLA